MWTIISSSYSPIDFQLPQLKTQFQPNKKYRIANPFLFWSIGGALVIGRRDYIHILMMWDHVNETCLYMFFSHIYSICRVVHGHRQVGRLALRTSDTCYIYTYWWCEIMQMKYVGYILFSHINYICRVVHGHRQVVRLALRTSDTCYIYAYWWCEIM